MKNEEDGKEDGEEDGTRRKATLSGTRRKATLSRTHKMAMLYDATMTSIARPERR
ncbi:uncharacterized protein DS421_15g521770 [Arachis hypogaea]|nr:uncharacterized protein DS421_15g521770 [Arachis hypogaea]